MQQYVAGLVNRNGYEKLVSYNTAVELVEKVDDEWRLVLRSEGTNEDEWWEERFDAVIVANGHYSVPYIPKIEGLEAFERARPGSVKHSKMYRGRDAYRGKVTHTRIGSDREDTDEQTESRNRWSLRVRGRHNIRLG